VLADKVDALEAGAKVRKSRTDIGLYLTHTANTENLALPVAYRRIEIPAQHYAKTFFDDFDELSDALTSTLLQLLNQQHRFLTLVENPHGFYGIPIT
jgi:hypothetical protein